MFDTNSEISETRPNLDLLLKKQSVQSLHKINKHYNEFQHALYMLKMSVEELWRLELEQLHKNKSVSPVLSKTRFGLQVPSIYTCRSVLPMASETIHLNNKISSKKVNPPIIRQPSSTSSVYESVSNKTELNKKKLQPNIQSMAHTKKKKKSTGSLLSINKKQRRYGSGDNFTKYWTKSALLHLKFRCLKHMD